MVPWIAAIQYERVQAWKAIIRRAPASDTVGEPSVAGEAVGANAQDSAATSEVLVAGCGRAGRGVCAGDAQPGWTGHGPANDIAHPTSRFEGLGELCMSVRLRRPPVEREMLAAPAR